MARFRVLRCDRLRAVFLLTAFTLTCVRPHHASAQFSTTLEPDTIPNAVTITKDIIVEGKVFTVRDVVRRAMRGERTKLGGHRDAVYKMTSHVAIVWPDKKTVETEIHSVYGDSTGFMRRVLVVSQSEHFKKKDEAWVLDKTDEGDDPGYRIRDYDFSRFTRVPVYLEDDQEFDFELLDRVLEADRVIFHVAFRPKSDFSSMPKGEIYIDSKGFRVIHELYEFNTNPMPMLIKGIRRISVQWRQLAGGEWVPKQLAAEMDIRNMWFAPNTVSFSMLWDDFQFDPGYDPHLFGKRDDKAADLGSGPIAASADTTMLAPAPKLLAVLQQEDDAAFTPDVRITNLAFIDSTSARYDSLGVQGLTEGGPPLYGDSWNFGFGPGLSKWDYNRVEGLVLGGEFYFGQADQSTRITAFGGYATASEKFRYTATFRQTLPATGKKATLVASFGDRVDPFGSNRPPLNQMRAFVGGADEQDYVHRVGGAARVVVTPVNGLSFNVGYAAARDRSAATDADFSLFGDMDKPNPPVDEGDEQALVAGAQLDQPSWLSVRLAQRVAGGSLGGDFRYSRTDLTIRAHGFVLGRQELDVTLAGVTTGDDPPLQRLADVGGLSTVRGYDRRTHVGNHSFAARLEYLVPYDLLAYTHIPLLDDTKVQFVPWGDAARVGEGDSQDWIRSAGIGLQRYLWPIEEAANLRLDFAFPFDNDAEDMVVYLWFTALF
jgi:hypothetical protein